MRDLPAQITARGRLRPHPVWSRRDVMSRPDLPNLASRLIRKSPAARGIWKHTLARFPARRKAATMPNLIIAGAQKCGTTSLHNYLAAHPDIFMPHHKEPGFFLDRDDREVENTTRNRLRYDLDDARLLRLMALGYRGEPWFGDSSTYYSMHPFMGSEAAANIAERSPDARVIYIVRHPLERMVSQYLWGERNRFALGSFRDVLDARLDVYLAISAFATQARHLLTHIDAERVLFLKSDELFRAPSVVVDRAACLPGPRQPLRRRDDLRPLLRIGQPQGARPRRTALPSGDPGQDHPRHLP